MELKVLNEVLRTDVLAAVQQHGVRKWSCYGLLLLGHVEIAPHDVLVKASDGENLLVREQVANCAVIKTHRP